MNISREQFRASAALLLCLSAACLATSISSASTIYTYREKSGTQVFTTELHSIPEQYRDDIIPLNFENPPEMEPAPPPLLLEVPPSPSEDAQTVTASGEYRMGDYDTRADAVRLAIEAAKRNALEQVATYLESVTKIRDMDVTRDDIRTYTAGIVKVLDQTITTNLDGEIVVVRVDLTAQIDPSEVVRAITALRRNESAVIELRALRAETDRLQQQLDAANRALADAASSEQVHTASQQRDEVLNELQANALVSQAWTSAVYVAPGVSSWIASHHLNGLLLQAQRLSPRHRRFPRAGHMPTPATGTSRPGSAALVPSPHPSLLVPAPHVLHVRPVAPSVVPGSGGAIAGPPTPKAAPPATSVPPSIGSSTQYQLHSSHFWRPSPPNIHTSPPASQPGAFVSPPQFRGPGKQFGGGGGHFRGGGGGSGGGRRGR